MSDDAERPTLTGFEFMMFDFAVFCFRGLVWFTALAGPSYVMWRSRTAHPIVLLLLVMSAWPLTALIFSLELVLLKRVLGRIPEHGQFVLGDPKALRFTAASVLMETMWTSPFWNLVTRNIFFRQLFYRGMGARIDATFLTSSGAKISEPWALIAGRNVLVGERACVIGHHITAGRLTLGSVQIGNDVTIGGCAIIFPSVIIGDGAVVGAGSLVTSGTVIPPGEVWVGSPARKLVSGVKATQIKNPAGVTTKPSLRSALSN